MTRKKQCFKTIVMFFRNESNIFSVDQDINQKRTENGINACGTLLQIFSFHFRFILYHLIFIAFQQRK